MATLIDTRPSSVRVEMRILGAPLPAAPRAPRPYDRIKAATDFAIGTTLLVITFPAVIVAAIAIKSTSRGRVIYSQLRVGRDGRLFNIFKLRTMYDNCEAVSGPRWSKLGDTRITPVGRFLRRLHIDELPQLWNVLCGDMSLVGPRPERPEFVVPLQQAIPGYSERLFVKPGVTGLAQIQRPPDSTIESVREKLLLDRCYVNRYGLWLDLRILIGTALYLAGVSYAGVRRLLRLPNGVSESGLNASMPSPSLVNV